MTCFPSTSRVPLTAYPSFALFLSVCHVTWFSHAKLIYSPDYPCLYYTELAGQTNKTRWKIPFLRDVYRLPCSTNWRSDLIARMCRGLLFLYVPSLSGEVWLLRGIFCSLKNHSTFRALFLLAYSVIRYCNIFFSLPRTCEHHLHWFLNYSVILVSFQSEHRLVWIVLAGNFSLSLFCHILFFFYTLSTNIVPCYLHPCLEWRWRDIVVIIFFD